MQDYRVDERERQRRYRERAREEGVLAVTCHAPASPDNARDLLVKVLESVDKAAALSRASLRRRIPVILRGLTLSPRTEGASGAAPSRAKLGAQVLETTADSG